MFDRNNSEHVVTQCLYRSVAIIPIYGNIRWEVGITYTTPQVLIETEKVSIVANELNRFLRSPLVFDNLMNVLLESFAPPAFATNDAISEFCIVQLLLSHFCTFSGVVSYNRSNPLFMAFIGLFQSEYLTSYFGQQPEQLFPDYSGVLCHTLMMSWTPTSLVSTDLTHPGSPGSLSIVLGVERMEDHLTRVVDDSLVLSTDASDIGPRASTPAAESTILAVSECGSILFVD